MGCIMLGPCFVVFSLRAPIDERWHIFHVCQGVFRPQGATSQQQDFITDQLSCSWFVVLSGERALALDASPQVFSSLAPLTDTQLRVWHSE